MPPTPPVRPVRIDPVNPDSLARPSGFSHGMVASGGRILHVAGQVGWNRAGELVSPEFVPQLDQALSNILAVVAEAGGAPEHVTRLRFYVTELDDYTRSLSEVGRVYRARMGKRFPAMALVQVAGLLEPGARVEIEADAVIPDPAEEKSNE